MIPGRTGRRRSPGPLGPQCRCRQGVFSVMPIASPAPDVLVRGERPLVDVPPAT